MPADDQDLIAIAQPVTITFALEPARNMLNSLCLLNKAEELSGLEAWVIRTATSLTPDQLRTNQVVCEGLHFAIQPDRYWPSFPAYVDGLAAQDPFMIRDFLFEAYAGITRKMARKEGRSEPGYSREELLADLDTFLAYLRTGFSDPHIDVAVETEAHALLSDPPAMQSLIVSHLREVWDQFLAEEWVRIRPMLRDSVNAFRKLEFAERTPLEVAAMIDPTLGGKLEKWAESIAQARQIIFVPSAHIGPYARKFAGQGVFGIFFGARLPEGAQVGSSALTRSELLVRLGAMADDTRLGILNLLAQQDELCAQEIMTHLGLSQSAASRHLRQLSATGYATERRRDGGKCYRVNRDRLRNTLHALERFLDL
jgi:DNA-binding transcriptional ArsR family regulator